MRRRVSGAAAPLATHQTLDACAIATLLWKSITMAQSRTRRRLLDP
jgi:hypothetical protein